MISHSPDRLLQECQVIIPTVPEDISERLANMGAECVFEGSIQEEVFGITGVSAPNPLQEAPEDQLLNPILYALQRDRTASEHADKRAGRHLSLVQNNHAPVVEDAPMNVSLVSAGNSVTIGVEGSQFKVPVEVDERELAGSALRKLGAIRSSRQHWRTSFWLTTHDAQVSVMSWPGMPSYVQIEAANPDSHAEIATLLGRDPSEIQSVTQAELFERYSLTPEYIHFGEGEIEVETAHLEKTAKDLIIKRAPHLNEEEVELIARHYLDAEYAGKRTHGLRKLCWDSQYYHQRDPQGPTIVKEKGAIAQIAGNKEIGPIAANKCVEMVIAKAQENGIASVAMTGSQRFGVLATWTKKIADAGLVGLLTVSTEPFTALHETATGVVGTNPLSIAVPYKNTHLVYDAAFSKAPVNTIWHNKLLGIELPEDTFLDKTGNFTTDPFYASTVNVFGGSKGSALAVMLQALSGPMLGAASHKAFSNPYENGFYVQAIDPEFFGGKEVFEAQMAELVNSIKQAPLKQGYTEILLPGERSQKTAEQITQKGSIVLHRNVWELLRFLQESA